MVNLLPNSGRAFPPAGPGAFEQRMRDPMNANSPRSGFTLIEILIVVVIMAVLAAAIIPQFRASTEDAKGSTLKFNLHTMRNQVALYKVHHRGTVPQISANDLPQLRSAS